MGEGCGEEDEEVENRVGEKRNFRRDGKREVEESNNMLIRGIT